MFKACESFGYFTCFGGEGRSPFGEWETRGRSPPTTSRSPLEQKGIAPQKRDRPHIASNLEKAIACYLATHRHAQR